MPTRARHFPAGELRQGGGGASLSPPPPVQSACPCEHQAQRAAAERLVSGSSEGGAEQQRRGPGRPGGRQVQRRILAILTAAGGQPVTDATLIAEARCKSIIALRTQISMLRRGGADIVRIQGFGYWLDAAPATAPNLVGAAMLRCLTLAAPGLVTDRYLRLAVAQSDDTLHTTATHLRTLGHPIERVHSLGYRLQLQAGHENGGVRSPPDAAAPSFPRALLPTHAQQNGGIES